MRILYLCADPGVPVMGRKGCSTHVREICRALVRAQHNVVIACANRGGDIDSAEGLRIVEIPPVGFRFLGFDGRLLVYNPRFDAALRSIIKRFRPEAIYERFSLYSFSGLKLVHRYNVPRLLEINAFLSIEQQDRLHFPRLARWADRRVVRHASHVIVVSEPLREVVASLGVPRPNIYKMPMSANVHHFTPEKSGEPIRKRFGLLGKYVIGYVGTLTGWHGINLLYEVARLLKRDLDNFVFLLVGGDEKKIALHQQKIRQLGLEPHFVITGSIPYDEVPEFVRAMDVTVIPDTTYWSSPTKLFEYQASGVPTVAPRYSAILEAMEEGKEGLFFDAHNTEQFADRLRELAQDPRRRLLMGQNARERVVKTHSIDQQVARLVEIFEEIRRDSTPRPS